MPTPEFPDRGILWRIWEDETVRIIADEQKPVLLFVRDTDPFVWPFLRETFKAMAQNDKLRDLLHQRCVPLYLEAEKLPEELKLLGAGSRYYIAVLSPSGLTSLVTIDPRGGKPAEVVERIVLILERILENWR